MAIQLIQLLKVGRSSNLQFGSMMQNACKTACNRHGSTSSIERPFTVSIEGNIASGKTKLLDYFARTPGVHVWPEPVDRWRNVRGHNALGLMYTDPARWSLALQTYVQLTMLQTHLAPQKEPVKLMERSIFSALYCFVENMRLSGKMADVEYSVLREWFDWIVASNNCQLDLIVYLRTSPETCYERIKRRCRAEEMVIPLEYLESLNKLYDDWLYQINESTVVPPSILVLDGNLDSNQMMVEYRKHRDEILNISCKQ